MSNPGNALSGASGGAALPVATPGPASHGDVSLQSGGKVDAAKKRRRGACGGWTQCILVSGAVAFVAVVVIAVLAGVGKLRKRAGSQGEATVPMWQAYSGTPCIDVMTNGPPARYAHASLRLDGATSECDGAQELFEAANSSDSLMASSLSVRGSYDSGTPVLDMWLLLEASDSNSAAKEQAFAGLVASPAFLTTVEGATGLVATVVEPVTRGALSLDPPPSTDDQPMYSSPPMSSFPPNDGGGGGGGWVEPSPVPSGPDANPFRTPCTEPDLVANFPLTVFDAYEGADWNMPIASTWYGFTANRMLSSANGKTVISGFQLSPSGSFRPPSGPAAAGSSSLEIRVNTVVPGSDTASGKDVIVAVTERSEEVVLGKFGDDGELVFDSENAYDMAADDSRYGVEAEILYIGNGKVAVATLVGGDLTAFAILQVNADEQLELVQDLSSTIKPQKLILLDDTLYFQSGEPQLLSRLDVSDGVYSVVTIADTETFIPALEWNGAIYGQGGDGVDLYKYTAAGGLELVAELTPSGNEYSRVMPTGVCGDKLFVTYNDVRDNVGPSGYHIYNAVGFIFANGTRGPDVDTSSPVVDMRGTRSPFTAACADGFLYVYNGWGPGLRIDARSEAPFLEELAYGDLWVNGPTSGMHMYAEAPGVGANSGNVETRIYMSMEKTSTPPSSALWVHVQHKVNQTEMQLVTPSVPPTASGNGGGLMGVCALGPDLTIAVYSYVGSWSNRKLQIRQLHPDQGTTTLLAEAAYSSVSGLFYESLACTYGASNDGTAYFPMASKADGLGREIYLWKSGMAAPSLFLDTEQGSTDGNPQKLTLVGDRLYFASGGRTLVATLPDNTTNVVSPVYTDTTEDTTAIEVLGIQQTSGDWRAFAAVPIEGTSQYSATCQLMTMGPSDTTLQVVTGVDNFNCPNRNNARWNVMAAHEGSLFLAHDNSAPGILPYVRGLVRVNLDDLSSELIEDASGMYGMHSLVSSTGRLYFFTQEGGSQGEIAYLDTTGGGNPTTSDLHKLTDLSSTGYGASIDSFGVAADGNLFACVGRNTLPDQFTVIEPVQGNFTELGGHTAGCDSGGSFCSSTFITKVDDVNYLMQNTGAWGYEVLTYPPTA